MHIPLSGYFLGLLQFYKNTSKPVSGVVLLYYSNTIKAILSPLIVNYGQINTF